MDKQSLQVLLFRWGNREFGIEIKDIQEILKFERTQPVPLAPPFMNRILNLRGRVFTVCFLNQLFKIEAAENGAESRVLVLRDKELQAGIYVDSVSDIHFLHPSCVGILPKTLSKRKSGMLFKGEIEFKTEKKRVLLFDLEAISKFLKEIKLQ